MRNQKEELPGMPVTQKVRYIWTGIIYTVLVLSLTANYIMLRPDPMDIQPVVMDDPQPDRLSMNKLFKKAAGN